MHSINCVFLFIGTPVLTVYASDSDGGTFSFSLTPTGQFTIDSTNGAVTVTASPTPPLDREVIIVTHGVKELEIWSCF